MPPVELDINGGVCMQYVYPAIFYKDKELPDAYSVIFPDVPGAATCGYSLYEAIYMAEDALAGMLVSWEDAKAGKTTLNNKIVEPTPISEIVAEPDEYSTEAFVTLIKADTDVYRKILEELPPREEDDTDENDDLEVPNTLAKELCRLAGIKFLFEGKK